MDPFSVSSSFMTLAGYIFGNNSVEATSVAAVDVDDENDDEAAFFSAADDSSSVEMGMTTPVIIDESSMSFVLPNKYTAATAPRPKDPAITIEDVGSQLLAARKFTGLATENEVAKQRAKLEDALISDGVMYDATTFKVFTYNPPLTLPWVRRNEVCFTVTTSEADLPAPLPVVRTEAKDDVIDTTATTAAMTNESKGITATSSEPAEAGAAEDDEEEFFTAPEAGD